MQHNILNIGYKHIHNYFYVFCLISVDVSTGQLRIKNHKLRTQTKKLSTLKMGFPEEIYLFLKKIEAENITCLLPKKTCYIMKKAVLYFNVWGRCERWKEMGGKNVENEWILIIMTMDQRKRLWWQYWCFSINSVLFLRQVRKIRLFCN